MPERVAQPPVVVVVQVPAAGADAGTVAATVVAAGGAAPEAQGAPPSGTDGTCDGDRDRGRDDDRYQPAPSTPRPPAPAPDPEPDPEPQAPSVTTQYFTTNTTYSASSTHTTENTWSMVIASDGSVVLVGEDGRLVANTGDAQEGGVVALESDGSTLQTQPGAPTTVPATGAPRTTATTTTGSGAGATASVGAGVAVNRGTQTAAVEPDFDEMLVPGSHVDYEDHSIRIAGDRQLVVYDDSNAFIDRDGKINSNTGDTDSSGLSAVDVEDTVVRTGSSGGVPDEPGEGEDGDEEAGTEAAVPTVPAALAPANPPPPAENPAPPAPQPASQPSAPAEESAEYETDLEYQDVSIEADGNGNQIVRDDSTVVIGGTGDVNSEIGDADTSGITVMEVDGSVIESDCSGDCTVP